MSQDMPEEPSEKPLQGAIFRPGSHRDLLNVAELAFQYRGDITLELKSRECITGYVFNRVVDGPRPYLELFQPDQVEPQRIFCSEIQAFHFTGEDTASGEDWESWVRNNEKAQARLLSATLPEP